jgi:hypothetical protein
LTEEQANKKIKKNQEGGEIQAETETGPEEVKTLLQVTGEIKVFDREGNVYEHIIINQDGKEEKINNGNRNGIRK